MKKNIRGLTLTAMLLSASTMSYAQQGTTSSIGDLPGYDEDAYFADEPTYQQQVSQIAAAQNARFQNAPAEIVPASHADSYAPAQSYQQPAYTQPAARSNATAPAHAHQPNANQFQSVGFLDGSLMGGRFNGPSCDTYGCDGGCDSGCASSSLGLGSMFGCGSDTWMTAEALLWFPQNRDMIPLVTTNVPGTAPLISNQNTDVAFGDEIEGGLSGGFRIDAGKYLSDNIGIGGRFWWLGENGDDYAVASDGTGQSVGRPFFDTTTPFAAPGLGPWRDNAVLVGFAPNITGNIAAESSLDLLGAEAYARINLGSSKTSKLELIGGYTHFSIDDTLRIHSRHINVDLFELRDEFEMENRFNGGQIGFEMTSSRGRWTARSLTKVHLGNMNQVATIRGQAAQGPLPTAIPIPGSEGLLSQNKTGVHERDVFAFVPEANFKLSYQFRNNVALSVGYSLLYFDNVALAGDVIDPMADGANLFAPAGNNAPRFQFDDSSLWVQGIDLGMVINF